MLRLGESGLGSTRGENEGDELVVDTSDDDSRHFRLTKVRLKGVVLR